MRNGGNAEGGMRNEELGERSPLARHSEERSDVTGLAMTGEGESELPAPVILSGAQRSRDVRRTSPFRERISGLNRSEIQPGRSFAYAQDDTETDHSALDPDFAFRIPNSALDSAFRTPHSALGLYDHGLYPFVFDPLWPVEGSPCGYGYVDLCRNTQAQIDMLDTAFLRNAVVGATPRYFERMDGSINEEEFKDLTSPVVHVAGTLDDTGIRVIDYKPLAGGYLNFYRSKISELRETSGNTESANGIYSGAVTAASAIASLQEASGKTSRDASRASYRAFAELTEMIIELVRQFYDLPRTFRIVGQDGGEDFVLLDNSAIRPQPLGVGSVDLG